MNYGRLGLAVLGGTVAYFAYGFLMFASLPAMKTEFMKYPNVYRTRDELMKVMPYGMVAIVISIAVVGVLHAIMYQPGAGLAVGAHLGMLIGIFSVGTFVVHNYVNLNIGLKLTVYQGVAYFFQWVIVGAVIGLIYKR